MNRIGNIALILAWCIILIACSPVASNPPNTTENKPEIPATSSAIDCLDNTVLPTGKTFLLTLVVTGEGTVTPTKGTYTYTPGTVVDLTAVAFEGWVFNIWIGNVENTMENPTTVKMNCDQTVMAYFSDAND
ncbi:hypothetical protein [Dehalogenimonas sp. 4OHTPN]|uniref:Bacterial repeat domain-containing protein n=1 Tax=Dehalogenimonas sp. 4OHTPN TaxID=3166643 RepID=A0AAU8GBK6_9CHLR